MEACLAPLFAFAELFLCPFLSSCLLLAAGFAGMVFSPACLVAWTSSSVSEYDSFSNLFSVTVEQRKKSVISEAAD